MKFCLWTYDEDSDSWDTGCGEKFCFIVDGPVENGMNFCPYCGKQLAIKVELPEDEDGASED